MNAFTSAQLFLPWGGVPGRCHPEGFISGSHFCPVGLCVRVGAGAALHGMAVPEQQGPHGDLSGELGPGENSWGDGQPAPGRGL